MRLCAILFATGLALTACGTPVVHNTPSGRPEVTIQGATPDQAGAEITNAMLDTGFTPNDNTSKFSLSFDKPVTNLLAAALLGSQYDSTPNSRIIYTITPSGSGTRIVATLAIITNPHSAFEHPTNMNNSQDSASVQGILDRLKVHFEGGVGPGVDTHSQERVECFFQNAPNEIITRDNCLWRHGVVGKTL
jgi:hypothetical protein